MELGELHWWSWGPPCFKTFVAELPSHSLVQIRNQGSDTAPRPAAEVGVLPLGAEPVSSSTLCTSGWVRSRAPLTEVSPCACVR